MGTIPKELIQIGDTRWNSIYYALLRLLYMEAAIGNFFVHASRTEKENMLSQEDWNLIPQVLALLSYSKKATELLQTRDYSIACFRLMFEVNLFGNAAECEEGIGSFTPEGKTD